MHKKYLRIIEYLNNQDTIRSSGEIALELNLSKRTVKNYVAYINGVTEAEIIISSRLGYKINRSVDLSKVIDISTQVPITLEERANYIMQQIITKTNKDDTNIFALCEKLFVSYSTLKKVIAHLNRRFEIYDVRIETKNNYLSLKGEERNKRKVIRNEIYANIQGSLLSLKTMQQSFPQVNVKRIEQIVSNSCINNDLYINDFAKINLILHLLIIIQRVKEGNHLNQLQYYLNLHPKFELMTNQIIGNLKNEYQIEFTDSEKSEIGILVNANANILSPKSIEELNKIMSNETITFVQSMVKTIEETYVINLLHPSFLIPFTLHINNLIYRMQTKNKIHNPMISQVKYGAPLIYDISTKIAIILKEKYKQEVCEDEIAFIALHIGTEIERQNKSEDKLSALLYCPNYNQLTEKIMTIISQNFQSKINVDNLVVISDLEQVDIKTFDVIFSTITLNNSEISSKVIEIPLFNTLSEFDTINKRLNEISANKQIVLNKQNFTQIFNEELFYRNPQFVNKKEFIRELCATLEIYNYVNSDYVNHVINREEASSTAFAQIAIPHSMHMDAIRTCISVAIFENGVNWDDDKVVYLVLLIAINEKNRKEFSLLYEELVEIFNAPENIKDIISIKEYGCFKEYILTKL